MSLEPPNREDPQAVDPTSPRNPVEGRIDRTVADSIDLVLRFARTLIVVASPGHRLADELMESASERLLRPNAYLVCMGAAAGMTVGIASLSTLVALNVLPYVVFIVYLVIAAVACRWLTSVMFARRDRLIVNALQSLSSYVLGLFVLGALLLPTTFAFATYRLRASGDFDNLLYTGFVALVAVWLVYIFITFFLHGRRVLATTSHSADLRLAMLGIVVVTLAALQFYLVMEIYE